MKIEKGYTFERGGNVFYYSQVGYASRFDTEDCSLYYTLDGNQLTIYYGVKGWKKEVRHTVFASGEYHGDYITINDEKYIGQ